MWMGDVSVRKRREVKWNTHDKCVYWSGQYVGKARTAEEAVAKTRTWLTEHSKKRS
jgi:hypothetical protein